MDTMTHVEVKDYFGNWLKVIHGELQLIRKALYEIKKNMDAKVTK